MKKSAYLIIAILGFYFSLFHAMEQTPKNIKSKGLIAFEIILNSITIFNHQLACSLALVNKLSNERIKNTAHLRKKHLESNFFSDHKRDQTRLVWHIHAGAYARVCYSANSKTLIMDYNYLHKKHHITNLRERWDNEPHLLLNEHKIFFNHKGDACYYASGVMQVLGHGKKREIIEYSLSIDNKAKITRCVLGKTNKKKEFQTMSLAHITKNSFPDLTQAILNSSHQYELSTPWHKDRIKVFHWDGVTIPQRYRKSQLYLDSQRKLII
jgi:hypothetical protein